MGIYSIKWGAEELLRVSQPQKWVLMSFVDDFPNMFFHDIWWFSQRHLDGRMDAQVGKAWEGRRNVAGLGCSMDEERVWIQFI